MRKRPPVQMLLIGAIGVAVLLPIALLVPWFPSSGSAQSHRVDTLFKVLLIVSVPVFVLVETVVIYSVWKFRMRPGQELQDGPPLHGNTRLEVIWTAAPAVVILALCIYAYAVLRADESSKRGETTVDVIGEQFAWMFSYPQSGGQAVVSPQLYLAKDQPVVFRIHSRDVLHAFWVPNFRLQLDAVPGITGTVRATPTSLGRFPLVCAELCGNGHSLMRAPVNVVTPAAFRTWMAAQKRQPTPSYSFGGPVSQAGTPVANAPAPSGAGSAAQPQASASAAPSAGGAASSTAGAAGKAVFVGAGGCGSCHTLADAGTAGQVGPNLGTKIVADAKRRGLALPAFIRESIVKPNAYISSGFPANVMPPNFAQSLSPAQLSSLVAYLAGVTK